MIRDVAAVSPVRHLLVAAAACLLGAGPALAQCDGLWNASIEDFSVPGLFRNATQPPSVFASIVWDQDGAGPIVPKLVVAGAFVTADGVTVNNIATWDGTTWASLAGGVNNPVFALLSVPNAGGGNDLIVGGSFTLAGTGPGVACTGVARWNGTTWANVGSTLPPGMGPASVRALARNGSGVLVAGGRWGTTVPSVVVLNSQTNQWQGLGGGLNQTPNSIAVTTNGDLYVGGAPFTVGGVNVGGVVRWTGTAWERPGSGVNGLVNVLTPLSDGRLAVGGLFLDFFAGFGNPGRIAIWNSNFNSPSPGWSELDGGVDADVRSIIQLADGSLLVGGNFSNAGTFPNAVAASRLARFNGVRWTGSGLGLANEPAPAAANAAALAQLASGEVFVGGVFTQAGGGNAGAIALWTPPAVPSFVQQPQDAAVSATVPDSATFVADAGVSPVEYAWQFRSGETFSNWQPIVEGVNEFFGTYLFDASGATAATLTVDRGQLLWQSGGEFRVIADNQCGILASRAATLLLSDDPSASPCDYDFNRDENVDLLDAQQMAQVFVGLITPEATWLDGDLNGDENADLTDAQLLAAYVVTGVCGV